MWTIVLPLPCVQQGDALQDRPSQQRVMRLCSPRAYASKPPCGSCRCSSSVVNFRCSVTRRFASLGPWAVTWLHNQCARCVKHSWVHFLTDSLCVLSRFSSAFSLFSLLVVSVCWMPFLFCFCFGSNRFYARRCFVHLEMYCHCRCVPALRGRSFWDVQNARRTSPSFLLASLDTSDVPCQVSCWERGICLVFFCSWSGHDVYAGQVFGDRPAGVLRRPCAKQPSLGASRTEGSGRWRRRRVSCLFSRCMWRSGQRQVHNAVPSLCDVRFTSLGFYVQLNSCLARLWVEWLGGFSDLPSTCLPCAGPRYDAARWTGCETQPLAVAPFLFLVFGRFFDAIPTLLSMRGHAARRSYRRNLGANEARSAQRQPRGLASGT